MGNLKDYATGTVLTAPSPATTGTSLVLQTGEGARMPATPFYTTAHPPSEFPTLDNAEKLQVTNVTGDTLTISRHQGDTSAKTIEAGWRISNAMFLADYTQKADAADLTSHTSNTSNPHAVTKSQVGLGSVTNDAQLKAADLDTDTALAANSDVKIPSQKAVKAYADALIAANDAMVFKGVIDASANPNYPAANRGDTYRISVAGKIGGASGTNVEVGDLIICLTDGTAAGNQATVGASWTITQTNIDGAVTGPSSSVDSEIALYSSTSGKVLKRASITGILKAASGVLAAAVAETDYVTPTGAGTIQNKTMDSTSPTAFFFPGFIVPAARRTAPTGWLLCDGSAISRSTYAALFAAICESVGTATITNATPAVVTLTAHGFVTGDQVYLTTTGALPTGLSANTLYYVVRIDANTFNLSTTRANAYAGTKIATSSAGSGTHTVLYCPWGLGDGSTTFTLPDTRGRILAGADAMGGTAASRLNLAKSEGAYGNVGAAGGEQSHTLISGEMPAHTHGEAGGGNFAAYSTNNVQINLGGGAVNAGFNNVTASTGGGGAHNTVQPTSVVNHMIKT